MTKAWVSVALPASVLLVGCATSAPPLSEPAAENVDESAQEAVFGSNGVSVDFFNIVRAETANYFSAETNRSGGNRLRHEQKQVDLTNQSIIRSNMDFVYSYGVFDASQGITITIPEYDLYQSAHVIDENHLTLAVVHAGETASIDPNALSFGEHVYVMIRTQPRSGDFGSSDVLSKRQNGVEIKNASKNPYKSEVYYDLQSYENSKEQLFDLLRNGRQARAELGFVRSVDEIVFPYYQIVGIAGWAGLPSDEAFYLNLYQEDDKTRQGKCSEFTFPAPELQYERNGYWSISVYDAHGWVATEKASLTSNEVTPNKNGTYTVRFNCGDDASNNLEVVPGWTSVMRLYLPSDVESAIDFRELIYTEYPITTEPS